MSKLIQDKIILFNMASRSRPNKFKKLVSYIRTHCTQPYLILAKIDDDDPGKDEYLTPGVEYAFGLSGSKIAAVNRGIPKEGWDILVDVSDDFVFTNPFFDMIIRHHCGPDDFVCFSEPFMETQIRKGWNEEISIMHVCGVDYYNRFGYVYNPVYKSLFCDNENADVARKLGRFKKVNDKIFYHAHPAAGYPTMDAQYKHTDSFYYQDKAVYEKRKGEGFV
jgi:hypothetical protein